MANEHPAMTALNEDALHIGPSIPPTRGNSYRQSSRRRLKAGASASQILSDRNNPQPAGNLPRLHTTKTGTVRPSLVDSPVGAGSSAASLQSRVPYAASTSCDPVQQSNNGMTSQTAAPNPSVLSGSLSTMSNSAPLGGTLPQSARHLRGSGPEAGEHVMAEAFRVPSNQSALGSETYSLCGPGGTRGKDSRKMDSEHLDLLFQQGFSTGLAKALSTNALSFDHRIWVVDNSGSMQIGDGHRIVKATKSKSGMDFNSVSCTRWEELQDAVRYHAQMAALLDSSTIFKLLNNPGSRIGPQQFSVAQTGEADVSTEIENVFNIIEKVQPGGVTPLTHHIWDIRQSVHAMSPQLIKDDKKVVVVLATDGLPTDSQGYGGQEVTDGFMQALRSLEGLPIWLVIRLCTDEEPVTRFYNALDGQLELSLEVLDDFVGEAEEVYRHNAWINYALPMHRCRELGYHDRLFDLIDERTLSKGEVRDLCCLIFGVKSQSLPDPGADWIEFMKTIKALLKNETLQWNPIKKKMMPWIDLKVLHKYHGNGKACVIM